MNARRSTFLFITIVSVVYAVRINMMAKIMQGECNGKTRKRSFIRLDTAEPPLIFYKNNASRVE